MSERTVWLGTKALKPLLVPMASLKLDPRNARRHSERNIEAIRQSLERFGQTKPVVARDGTLFAGEGTLRAADLLGWTHIAAAPAEHLSEDEVRAYALADNKTGELAEWDKHEVAALFADMPTDLLDVTGFDDAERGPILRLLDADGGKDSPESFGLVDPNAVGDGLEHQCPKCGYKF